MLLKTALIILGGITLKLNKDINIAKRGNL